MTSSIEGINRASVETINLILTKLTDKPIVTAGDIAEWTGYTTPGAYKVIDRSGRHCRMDGLYDAWGIQGN